jgi:hypothetical protein
MEGKMEDREEKLANALQRLVDAVYNDRLENTETWASLVNAIGVLSDGKGKFIPWAKDEKP